MLTPFYVYETDPECENCEYGKGVTTDDFDCFHICFASHDKSDEDKCSYYRFKMIKIEAERAEWEKKYRKPKQMEIVKC